MTSETHLSGTARACAAQFATARAVRFDGSSEDLRLIAALSRAVLGDGGEVALYVGDEALAAYWLRLDPALDAAVEYVLGDAPGETFEGRVVLAPEDLPATVGTVLLASAGWRPVAAMRRRLLAGVRAVCLADLPSLAPEAIPPYAWVPRPHSIYPFAVPEITFKPGQDLILLDVPARSLAQLPVGFAYVHDALARDGGVKFQTVDADIVIYHRYHADRILDGLLEVHTATGRRMPDEPWDPSGYLLWKEPDVLDLFEEDIRAIVNGLVAARPRILGCSLQEVNIEFMKRVVGRVKAALPELIVVGGGMSCLQPGAARIVFPLADYIVVGEADLTMPRLVRRLLAGERVVGMPGVWSKDDPADRLFEDGEIPADLDALGHPRYEWTDIGLYRCFNDYRLAPVVGSRGCSWARCRFCAERFHWRPRDPVKVADDLEFFSKAGFGGMVFNESDFHGDVGIIDTLCDEILRRGIKAHYTVQLRCNRQADAAYYRKLRQAGFGTLRFGIDACSEHTLRLQNKGYTVATLEKSLRLATEAGLFTEVNIVIGVPGETEEDIDASIDLLVRCKPCIGRIAFINPLMLFRGSDYWNRPEKYGIVFHEDRDSLCGQYAVALPNGAWHSENPFIDEGVRYKRFLRIVKSLRQAGFDMTAWVDFTIDKVEEMARKIDRTPEEQALAAGRMRAGEAYRGFRVSPVDGGFAAARLGSGGLPLPAAIQARTAQAVRRAVDLQHAIAAGQTLAAFRSNDTLVGFSTDGLELRVDRVAIPGETPKGFFVKLVETYKDYNICGFDGLYYAVPRSLGPVNLTQAAHRRREGILAALSLSQAREFVDAEN